MTMPAACPAIAAFAQLMDALGRHGGLDIRPLSEFGLSLAPDRVRVAIRCDMGGDPSWTLALARMAAGQALPFTVFADPAQPYFHRDDWLAPLIVAGPEIGLKMPSARGGENAAKGAVASFAKGLARLRGSYVNLKGVAFDPPGPDSQEESFEAFDELAGSGGRASGGGLSLTELGFSYTTMIGQAHDTIDALRVQAYLAAISALEQGSVASWQLYFGSNPLWHWDGNPVFLLLGDGSWVRFLPGSGDYPQGHGDVAEAVDWIAGCGQAKRFLFLIHPAPFGG